MINFLINLLIFCSTVRVFIYAFMDEIEDSKLHIFGGCKIFLTLIIQTNHI